MQMRMKGMRLLPSRVRAPTTAERAIAGGARGATHPRPPLDVVAGQLAGVLVVVALGHQRVHDGHQLADAGAVGLASGDPRDLVAPDAPARLLLPRHHLAVVEHAVAVQAAHLRPDLVGPTLACNTHQHSFSLGSRPRGHAWTRDTFPCPALR